MKYSLQTKANVINDHTSGKYNLEFIANKYGIVNPYTLYSWYI